MKYNILTPLSRFQNYDKLKEMLKSQIVGNVKLNWVVIIDDAFNKTITPSEDEDWIKVYICPARGTQFWEKCNNSLNWFLDTFPVQKHEKYLFLNDDDCYEPGFFSKIDKLEYRNKIIAVSMKRGNRTPSHVIPERAHAPTTLWAAPENMVVCRFSVEQIVIPGSIMCNYRLPIHICGDGLMLQAIVENNKNLMVYLKDVFVLFNYLEEGRWD